jgi:hypothetical protein
LFEDGSFDAVTCIDAINHLPDRPRPIVITGPITNKEIAIRASIGLFVFVPAGVDACSPNGAVP